MATLRFKLESKTCAGNTSYIKLARGRVTHLSRSGKPLALSTITEDATELMFALEVAENADAAAASITKFCKGKTVTAL